MVERSFEYQISIPDQHKKKVFFLLMFEKKFRYDKMSPIMLILCSLSRITYIFRPSTEHVYVSPNIY